MRGLVRYLPRYDEMSTVGVIEAPPLNAPYTHLELPPRHVFLSVPPDGMNDRPLPYRPPKISWVILFFGSVSLSFNHMVS